MEKISNIKQIPKGELKTVIQHVDENLLHKLALTFANIDIDKALPGKTWDDLTNINSLWDYIHVGNNWNDFKEGIKLAVKERLTKNKKPIAVEVDENSSDSLANQHGMNLKPKTMETPNIRITVRKAIKEFYESLNPPDTEESKLKEPEIKPTHNVYQILFEPTPPYTFFKGVKDGKLYVFDAELDKAELKPYATLELTDFEDNLDSESGPAKAAMDSEIVDMSEAYKNFVNSKAETGVLPTYTGPGSFLHNQGSDTYAMYSADSGIIEDIKHSIKKGYILNHQSTKLSQLEAILKKFGF